MADRCGIITPEQGDAGRRRITCSGARRRGSLERGVVCESAAARLHRPIGRGISAPGGKTPMDNCRMYEPLIADAARQKADLAVLGEVVPTNHLGRE
jgi:hypothetical protein